jgi:hypothetical protein
MEYATSIAVTAAVVVILLQVIIIALILNAKKKLIALIKEQKPSAPSFNQERNERRDRDFRRDRRPQEQRPPRPQQAPVTNTTTAPQAAAASADPMEKSLRDINLRLKNAERDQEFARRKMQESFPRDRDRRDDRPRGGNRDRGRDNHRRDNRDFRDRDNRRERGNWQERNNNSPSPAPQVQEPREEASFEVAAVKTAQQQAPEMKMAPAAMPSTPVTPVTATPATPPTPETPEVINDLGVSEDNLQHGRKFTVKRRMLKEEGQESGEVTREDASTETPGNEQPKSEGESEISTTEVKFGRR